MNHVLLVKRSYQFIPSRAESQQANLIAGTVTFGCLAISCIVLALAFYLWYDKALRHHFNKISTQLLYLCVALTIPQGLAFASTTLNVGRGEQSFCRFGMVFVVFGFNATNWIQCCVCVNLILALRCPGIFRYRVKLWYIVSAVISSTCFALIPLIANQYAWSSQNRSCWIRDDNTLYNMWQLAVLEFPLLIVTVFMFVSVGFVINHLLQQRRLGKSHAATLNQLYEPAFNMDADDLAITSETNMNKRFEIEEVYVSENFCPNVPPSPTTPTSKKSPRSIAWSPRAPSFMSYGKTANSRPTPPVLAEIIEEPNPVKVRIARLPLSINFGSDPATREKKELRKTVLRICCFPIIHLLISVLSPLGSLILASSEHSSRCVQVGLYYMTFLGSAWVPLAYSVCALLADTAIYEAIAERRQLRRESDPEESLEMALGRNKHRLSGVMNLSSDASHAVGEVDTFDRVVQVTRIPEQDLCGSQEGDSEELGAELDETSSGIIDLVLHTPPQAHSTEKLA